jgi:hypothetical protein
MSEFSFSQNPEVPEHIRGNLKLVFSGGMDSDEREDLLIELTQYYLSQID